MKLIDKIIFFFKKIFKTKNEEIKMISAPKKIAKEEQDFIDSLKLDLEAKSKNKVETLICYGDGLGIKSELKY